MRKFLLIVGLLILILNPRDARADWPDAPWINGAPHPNAVVTAIAFVSPLDLQFFRVMHVWKKLQKRYGPSNVDFLIVAMQEAGLPFNDSLVETTVSETGYTLPVLIDGSSRYSKLWRAYVSPTVNLVLREGKVTSLDPGTFDATSLEKTLQKLLKENGVSPLPAKEYPSENENKNCGHPTTTFLGEKFQKAWGSSSVSLRDGWAVADAWAEKSGKGEARMDIPFTRSSLGIIAETKGTAKVTVTLDGAKVPSELRGHDLQEDKSGSTYFTIRGPRIYEILAHPVRQKDATEHLLLSTDAKDLKVWAVQSLPYCLDQWN